MEETSSSHNLVSRSSADAKRVKINGATSSKEASSKEASSKGTSRSRVPLGLPCRIAEFLRRGSPRPRQASLPPYGEAEDHSRPKHSSSKKGGKSSRHGNGSEGSKKTPKIKSMKTLNWNYRGIGNDLTV